MAKKWSAEVETRLAEVETRLVEVKTRSVEVEKGQVQVENDEVGPGRGRKYPLSHPLCYASGVDLRSETSLMIDTNFV